MLWRWILPYHWGIGSYIRTYLMKYITDDVCWRSIFKMKDGPGSMYFEPYSETLADVSYESKNTKEKLPRLFPF